MAREIYEPISALPLVCPHGHVDPRLFADDDAGFGSPAELLIIPDHYVVRMLYSQGIAMDDLGLQRIGTAASAQDHRAVWQLFADHFYLFRGTPSGVWLKDELYSVFGIRKKLNSENAQEIYDQIEEKLATPEFQPRALFEQFNIEVLCTTDAAADTLSHHQRLREGHWQGNIRPTFRPDAVVNLLTPGWKDHIGSLGEVSGVEVDSYLAFLSALEQRREVFRGLGATATDHAALTAATAELERSEAEKIFDRALRGQVTSEEADRFAAHMLMEMARMSLEDGLVMQLHVGSFRNHNPLIASRFGADAGADIPTAAEFTRNLRPLLEKYGNEPSLTLILFTLDETTYSRELAPLAGHYPALRLGPPWWFHDSLNGIQRYLERVVETAGIYNTAGFNDDTRAFPSIPARHDLWRRVCANWLAGVLAGVIDTEDAAEMAHELAYGLAKRTYRLDS
jgi:glucuronate isomerase